MTNATYPTVDESLARLLQAGWHLNSLRLDATDEHQDHDQVWVVTGHNGENELVAFGGTWEEALWSGCCQARCLGLLAGQRQLARPGSLTADLSR